MPATLFLCAVVVGVVSATSGFSHLAPFVVLCFVAAASLLVSGVAILAGVSNVSRSRALKRGVGIAYLGVGLVTLLVAVVFFGLMNTCLVCY